MQIRPLTKNDFDYIVTVLDRWWGGPSGAMAHPIFFYELGEHAVVAVEGDEVVGFLLGFHTPQPPKTAYIHLVGIHPDFRLRGVGKMLYSNFIERSRAAGATRLKAITSPGNDGSVRFHERLGFEVKEEPNYAGEGRARVVFTKAL